MKVRVGVTLSVYFIQTFALGQTKTKDTERVLLVASEITGIAKRNRQPSGNLPYPLLRSINRSVDRLHKANDLLLLAHICQNIGWPGSAEDRAYDSVIDVAYHYSVLRLSKLTDAEAVTALRVLSIGQDGESSLYIKDMIAGQNKRIILQRKPR